MKIAYLVIAYEDPEQLAALASRLTKTADVFLHINARVDERPFREAVYSACGREKVFFVKNRVKVHWGGFSILQAAMELLREAFGQGRYDRFVLLTGLDYPIKSDREILSLFEEYRDRSFIHAGQVDGTTVEHCNYYQYRDCYVISKIIDVFIMTGLAKLLPKKKDYYVADGKTCALWFIAPKWALTGAHAEYVLNFYDKHPDVNRYFKFKHAPDDFYVGSVLMNSEYADEIYRENDLFYIFWTPNNGAKVLDSSDYEALKETDRFMLYAKKFHWKESRELISRLERDNRE